MKIPILSTEGKQIGQHDLPFQFAEPVREDLIKRAVHALQSSFRQKYGSDPRAGKKVSIKISRRRRSYRGAYGKGISRVPRKVYSIRGSQINWTGAFAPGTVGGRRAHPPKSEKNWKLKLNKKENKKAIRSALSAVVQKEFVVKRGHKVPDNYPFAVEDKIEKITKARELLRILKSLGLEKELARTKKTCVRAGKGKSRGRKTKTKKGPLIVVSGACDLLNNQNLVGFDIRKIKELNAEELAPGGGPGRLTIFSSKALEIMNKEKLFI